MTRSISDRYRLLATRFDQVIAAVPADGWSRSSPCEDWTARDVLDHVVRTELDFLQGQPFAPNPPIVVSDPLRDWPMVRDAMQRLLDDRDTAGHEYEGFFGPTTFEQTINDFYCLDLVIHAWDIATATGLERMRAIEPEEMAACRAGLESVGDGLRMPGIFGPEVDVAVDADAQTRFLAFVGRSG